MIFGDTSVWVEALRSAESTQARELSVLLDAREVGLSAPVRIEILAGASRRDHARLRRVLSALPLFFPRAETWGRIDEWLGRARDAGERFGFADLLIAAIAADQDSPVWSLDADFRAGVAARTGGVSSAARSLPLTPPRSSRESTVDEPR